jgi:hypothetical protein
MYRRIIGLTQTLGTLIYDLKEEDGVYEPFVAPPKAFEGGSVHYDLFRDLMRIYMPDEVTDIRPSSAKLIQKAINYLLEAAMGPRQQLAAIGSAAYKLRILLKKFDTLTIEIAMRAVNTYILRRTTVAVLPSAALHTFHSDPQNIHTPMATRPTEQALAIIMAWPSEPTGSGSILFSRIVSLSEIPSRSMSGLSIWSELIHDMSYCVSFGLLYGTVLRHILIKIGSYSKEIQDELIKRLIEEISEGSGLCDQGKMTRLVNVLRGFEPEIDACVSPVPSREEFQNRIAMIPKSSLPVSMQKELAIQLMDECLIPEGERDSWLTALNE